MSWVETLVVCFGKVVMIELLIALFASISSFSLGLSLGGFALTLIILVSVIQVFFMFILPCFLIFIIAKTFHFSYATLLFHVATLGLFNDSFDKVGDFVEAFVNWVPFVSQTVKDHVLLQIILYRTKLSTQFGKIKFLSVIYMLFAVYMTTLVARRTLMNPFFLFVCVMPVYIFLAGFTWHDASNYIIADPFGLFQVTLNIIRRVRVMFQLLVPTAEGRQVRRFAFAILVVRFLNVMHACQLLSARHRIRNNRTSKAKIMRSMSMAFAKFVEGMRLPQIFRTPAEAGFSRKMRMPSIQMLMSISNT